VGRRPVSGARGPALASGPSHRAEGKALHHPKAAWRNALEMGAVEIESHGNGALFAGEQAAQRRA